MEITIKITADEKALEFARDIARSSSKLGIIGDIDELKERVKATVESEVASEEDKPWETIEPDPIKVDEVPKEEVSAPEKEPTKKYTTEEIRAAGADYIKRKGKPAFKVLLTQYNINKLTELPEEKYADFMEDCDNAR